MNDARHIEGAHSSGNWMFTDSDVFLRNVRRLRRGHTFVTRTEGTDHSFNGVLNWPDDGWGLHHPTGLNCAVEWDRDEWAELDRDVLVLTDIRIRTKKGFLQPAATMPLVNLENRHNGGRLLVGSAHLDLSNTALRRQANLDECHTLRKYLRGHKGHAAISFDGNRNQRLLKWQRYFDEEMLAGTDLRRQWKRPLPRGGTHGRTSLLDLTISDLPGRNSLLADDASSDHRPIRWVGTLPGAR